MTNYIDGFVLPIAKGQTNAYREIAEEVAKIWREHGALDYSEFILDSSALEGTQPFSEATGAAEDETVIFGWVSLMAQKLLRGCITLTTRTLSSAHVCFQLQKCKTASSRTQRSATLDFSLFIYPRSLQ